MNYALRPGLHACATGGSVVLLDVIANRYFALAPDSGRALISVAEGASLSAAQLDIIASLAKRDILQRSGLGAPLLCPARGAIDGPAADDTNLSAAAAWYAALAIARAEFELRLRPFASILRGIERAKRRAHYPTPIEPLTTAKAFEQADRLVSARNRCLPRAIALARAVLVQGHAPDLVFGVKLRPFEAHCWVEHCGTILGDRAGDVGKYSPILVV